MHTATRRGSPGANVVPAAAAPLLGNAEAATITAIAGGPGEGPALSFGQQSVRVAVLSGRTKHMCPSVHPALLLSCLLAASLAYLHECFGSLAVSVILSTGQAAFATCPSHAGVYERVGRAGWLMEMRSFAIADPVFLVSGSMGRERGRGGGRTHVPARDGTPAGEYDTLGANGPFEFQARPHGRNHVFRRRPGEKDLRRMRRSWSERDFIGSSRFVLRTRPHSAAKRKGEAR